MELLAILDTENREEINSGYNNSDNGPAEYYSFMDLISE